MTLNEGWMSHEQAWLDNWSAGISFDGMDHALKQSSREQSHANSLKIKP